MKSPASFLFFIVFCTSLSLHSFQKNNTNISFDSIYKTVNLYYKLKENDRALIYSRLLLQKALDNNNLVQEAKSYYKIASFHRKLNNKGHNVMLPLIFYRLGGRSVSRINFVDDYARKVSPRSN